MTKLVTTAKQPSPSEEPSPEIPPEIPQFFRLPPWLLILGSFCIVITLDFSGGIDPAWRFEFEIAPADYETLKSYRSYDGSLKGQLQHHDESNSQFYYLDYDPATRRCQFQSLDY